MRLVALFALLAAACAPPAPDAPPVAAEPTLERLADGFQFTEGPVWHDGALYFSDIPANTIYRWTEADSVTVFRTPSQKSNGLAFDAEGRLLMAQDGARVLARLEPDGTETVLASHYDGKHLTNPNDLAVHPDGSIYFTDPGWSTPPEEAELDFQGVYRVASDGTLTLLVDSLSRPNGIAFSPDFETLYVTTSDTHTTLAYDVENHTLSNGRLFAASEGEGATDGLKTGKDGRVYVTAPVGVEIYAPDGTLLHQVAIPEQTTNIAWGEDDKTLYVTAATALYRIRLPE